MIFKNNRVYDVIKWIVITAAPALITLITGLGMLFGFDSTLITGTISLVTAFVGTLIGISGVQYAKAKADAVEATDEDTAE